MESATVGSLSISVLQTDEQLSKHEACGAALAYVTTAHKGVGVGTFMQIFCNYPEDRETLTACLYNKPSLDVPIPPIDGTILTRKL